MKSELITTAVVLRDLECFNLDTLEKRIILQKKVFLAQQFGISLGYSYSWYIHGPYSTELTAIAYECIPLGMESIKEYKLNNDTKQIIDKVNNLHKYAREAKLTISSWYELLASLIYWSDFKKYLTQDIINIVLSYKPQFTRKQAELAIEVLRSA